MCESDIGKTAYYSIEKWPSVGVVVSCADRNTHISPKPTRARIRLERLKSLADNRAHGVSAGP